MSVKRVRNSPQNGVNLLSHLSVRLVLEHHNTCIKRFQFFIYFWMQCLVEEDIIVRTNFSLTCLAIPR